MSHHKDRGNEDVTSANRRLHRGPAIEHDGCFLDARHAECAVRNEQLWIDLEEPGGRFLRVKQISGAIARRIVCRLKIGETVDKGERLGMIKFGSRTDLLVPVEAGLETLVKVRDKVKGGATVLLRVP